MMRATIFVSVLAFFETGCQSDRVSTSDVIVADARADGTTGSYDVVNDASDVLAIDGGVAEAGMLDGGVRDAGSTDSGVSGTLLFLGDFEAAGSFVPGSTYPQFSSNIDTCEHDQMCTTDSLEIVTTPVRRGTRAVRVTLRDGDVQSTSGTRAELQTTGRFVQTLEEDYWYGWSMYVPTDWTLDPGDMKVVHQWHTGGSNPGPSPIIGLRIRGTKWQITRELVDGAPSVLLWEADVQKGVWVDWVMRVRWSTGSSGSFTTWQNGAQVYADNVQNLATGTTTPEHYQKFGLYGVFGGTVRERVLYFDEVRVAKGPSAYSLVAP